LTKIAALQNLHKRKFSRLHLWRRKTLIFASNNTLEQGRNAYFLCPQQKMHKMHKKICQQIQNQSQTPKSVKYNLTFCIRTKIKTQKPAEQGAKISHSPL